MLFDQGVRLFIKGRSGGEPGFFVTGEHSPLLRWFSCVEENPNTDFSRTKKQLEAFLNVNHPEGQPHTVAFDPDDPREMAALGVVEAHIEVTIAKAKS